MRSRELVLTTLFLAVPVRAAAATPDVIRIQGYLTALVEGDDEIAFDGTVPMGFRLCRSPRGEDCEPAPQADGDPDVDVLGGVFAVTLGPFEDGYFVAGGPWYVSITVGDDQELDPRPEVVSVPYALHAATADEAALVLDVGPVAEAIVEDHLDDVRGPPCWADAGDDNGDGALDSWDCVWAAICPGSAADVGDVDEDGDVDLDDCRELLRGPAGERGEPGQDGADGQDGAPGGPGSAGAAGTSCDGERDEERGGVAILCGGEEVGFAADGQPGAPALADVGPGLLTSVLSAEPAAEGGPGAGAHFVSPVAVDGAGAVRAVAVWLDYAHPDLTEVEVSLWSPSGTEVALHARGEGADLAGWSGEGWEPAEPLAALAGEEASGEWALEVTDGDGGGVLSAWSLRLEVLSATEVVVGRNLTVGGALVVDGTDVAGALAAMRASLAEQQARIWCLEECNAAVLDDCQAQECDGAAQTCDVAGPAPDGTRCDGGRGCCRDGECDEPATCVSLDAECGEHDDGCGGVVDCGGCGEDEVCEAGECVWDGSCGDVECPDHPEGWAVSCNGRDHCEYAPADDPLLAEVWVPAGVMPMGSPDGEPSRSADESPVHGVTFAQGFWIGKHEVTVTQYGACGDPGCTAPSVADSPGQGLNTVGNGRSDHPQNGLQWQQSVDYCAWRGMRLPSEAEWEYAAKGPVHRKYPWGDGPEPTCANGTANFDENNNAAGCTGTGTLAVGSKPAGASWSGALDMSGNVWECIRRGSATT